MQKIENIKKFEKFEKFENKQDKSTELLSSANTEGKLIEGWYPTLANPRITTCMYTGGCPAWSSCQRTKADLYYCT